MAGQALRISMREIHTGPGSQSRLEKRETGAAFKQGSGKAFDPRLLPAGPGVPGENVRLSNRNAELEVTNQSNRLQR